MVFCRYGGFEGWMLVQPKQKPRSQLLEAPFLWRIMTSGSDRFLPRAYLAVAAAPCRVFAGTRVQDGNVRASQSWKGTLGSFTLSFPVVSPAKSRQLKRP